MAAPSAPSVLAAPACWCGDGRPAPVRRHATACTIADARATYGLLTFADEEALRGHLDALNESGNTPVAVGIDGVGAPFLITLVGPYAESEDVLFDSPWQSDVDWRDGHSNCEDCRGWSHGIDNLRYPVTVMTGRSS
jgi:hypothetical protein